MNIPQHFRQLHIAYMRAQLQLLRNRHNIVMLVLINAEEEAARPQRRRRTVWVKPWLQRRVIYGQYETLMQELMREAHGDFKTYMRMTPGMFMELLERISPRIIKLNIQRRPLEPGLKLAITLRFLAMGDSYMSLSFDFRVAHNTISVFVPQVRDSLFVQYIQQKKDFIQSL